MSDERHRDFAPTAAAAGGADATTEDLAPRSPGARLGRRRARAKLEHGYPLLHDEPLDLDSGYIVGQARRLLASDVGTGFPLAGEAATALGRAEADLTRIAEEAFVGHRDHLAQLTAPLGGLEPALGDALEQAARGLLRLAAQEVSEHLESVGWDLPYCPVCGAVGDLTASGSLACPRCLTRWRGRYNPLDEGFRLELALRGERDDKDWLDA